MTLFLSHGRAWIFSASLALGACAATRDLSARVALAVAPSGVARSEVLRFRVPPRSRSVAVQVSGDPDATYALAAFRVAGREFILPSPTRGAPPAEPRQGTFAFLYPFAPGQPAPTGVLELVVRSDRAATVRVQVLAPRDDGARVLHLNLFVVSREAQPGDPTRMIAEAQAILRQAGLRLRVDRRFTLRDTPWSAIDVVTEPWETPRGPTAQLCAYGAALVDNGALNVYVVDRLPLGSEGLSLGVPGPFLASASYYYGVVLRRSEPAAQGRALAHELAHFLGLPHVRTITPDALAYDDALDDTEPGSDNLMEHGTRITRGQAFVLSRSPLLKPY